MTEIKREYVVPLRRGFQNTPRYKRTHKAIRVLKEFIVKNMKSDDVKIGKRLNDFMWKHGIKNPPAKVNVVAIKDKDNQVKVELSGFDYVEFKQIADDEPKNLKEKLQSKVKGDVKPEEKAHEVTKGTARTPEGDVKPAISEPKAEVKEKPAKAEKPKAEVKPEVKEEPKAE